MSMCYWICEGVGVRTNDLYPHLNRKKCIELIEKKTGDTFVGDEDEFDIDEYLYGEVYENLAEMLCDCDETNTLSWGDNGNGEYFFFYCPTYPWSRRNNEPSSLDEVHERIKNAIIQLCNLPDKEIEKMIDNDIYEYGCG